MSTTTAPTYDDSGFLGPHPDVARLLDNVQAEVPAVGLEIVKMAAWNTIEEFYIRSTFRRETVYWEMGTGTSEVNFNPYDSKWLVAWLLFFDGIPRFRVHPPARVTDAFPPTSYRSGSALLALKPCSWDAVYNCSCDTSELWSNWFEVIKDGVLYRLFKQPAKPWSSPQLAEYHGKEYRAGIARARATAQAGYNGDPGGRWAFPQFARGRRKN